MRKKSKLEHGGEWAVGRRKSSRPLALDRAHHVVLRAEDGVLSFIRKERRDLILFLIQYWAKHFKVRVYARSVNATHIHLAIYSKSLSSLHSFLRVCPGQIAQRLKKGKGKFWKHLVYTRIVAWGRAYLGLIKYIEQNTLEAAGLIPYTPRKTRYGPG